MAKKGRPVTNTSPEAQKRRERQKKWYSNLSPAEKKMRAQARSEKSKRRAEQKRSGKVDPARQAAHNKSVAEDKRQHPEKERARGERPPKPAGQKCSAPGCDRPATEYHHLSYNPPRGTWRCSRHNPRGGAVKS
jgi:hypothetical protein